MSRGGRSPAAMLLALVGVVALGVAGSMSSIVQLSAVVTALVMGGNTNPDPSTEYVDSQIDNYYDASFTGVRRGIHTPEEFWPNNGTLTFDQSTAEGVDDLEHEMDTTDGELVIVGYSASTRIASAEKNKLIAEGDYSRDITFVLISDVNKGNGGILARFGGWTIPILGVTFDGATRTDSENGQFETKSVTFVHDGWSDFPIYPANVLADANAVAGIALLHGTYPNLDNPTLTPVGSTGDTDYYVIETDIVPLLMPLESAGVPRAVLLVVDEPTRVLIETAYRRDIDPGAPTPAYLIPVINPVSVATNFAASIPVGIDDGLEASDLGRPLGTQPSGPFGVGGEDEDLEGLPAGFVPLGNPAASTADPPVTSTLAETQDEPEAKTLDEPPVEDKPAVKPKPLRPKVRNPISMGVPKLPKLPKLPKPGDRPLKRLVDGLTGQNDKPEAGDTESAPADSA